MASSVTIDIDKLLKPISEESPAGSDIREDRSPTSPYQTIKGARNAARAAERNNLFDSNNNEADQHWRTIVELAPDILASHGKDLEIACWYTEALVRMYGFQGLRDGFTLIRGLISQYWDPLFPLPDEDGLETRVACLSGLNGEGSDGVLITPIRSVCITEDIPPGPFNFWQYQQALEIEKIIDEEARASKAAKNGFSVADVERAVNESDDTFFINLRDNLRDSIDIYRETNQLLDELCGPHDAPPTSNILNTLSECLGIINHLGQFKLPSENEDKPVTGDNSPTSTGNSGSGAKPAAANNGLTREQAFQQLINIAEFFRKTEPHSPISYMLEKTVKWGKMPLSELMNELIPDSSSRDHYSSLTGVNTDNDNY